jgi:hypothetical protein
MTPTTDEQETKAPEKNLKELTEAIFNLVSAVAMTIPDENQVFEEQKYATLFNEHQRQEIKAKVLMIIKGL